MTAVLTAADPAAVAQLLGAIDERDYWLRRLLSAERRAYELGHQAGYREGRRDEGDDRDAQWHSLADPLARRAADGVDLTRRRWRVRGEEREREDFGRPHPGDRPVRTPRPSGPVWLGGPPVHYHGCSAACYAFRPGPYSPAEAAAILATLPGHYAEEIASLRARASRERAAS